MTEETKEIPSSEPRRSQNSRITPQSIDDESFLDAFTIKEIYPDAASIFTFRLKPVDEIKSQCCIVLDTNVLLDLYITGEVDLLNQCEKIYKKLIKEKRLIIPGQVAGEFARNRTKKLEELNSQLLAKKAKLKLPEIRTDKFPLLSSLETYKEVLALEDTLEKKKKEFEDDLSNYQKAVEKVLNKVHEWRYNDPVSKLYQQLFNVENILDPLLNQEEIRKDLLRRQQFKIPPGYKDSSKSNNAEGDLIIWKTILEAGKIQEKDVIFVSKDIKPDWWQASNGQPLYPRYELVYEFMNFTGGKSFHIIRFSEFLKLFGANEQIVEGVQEEERQVALTNSNWSAIALQFEIIVEEPEVVAVKKWAKLKFPHRNIINYSSESNPRFIFVEQKGILRGFIIVNFHDNLITFDDIEKYYRKLDTFFEGEKISSLRIILVSSNEEKMQELVSDIYTKPIPKGIAINYGYINIDGLFEEYGFIPF